MFDIYTDSIANILQNMFNQYELNISHTNCYYRINGFDYEKWQNDIQSKSIEKSIFAIALDYSFISDYKATKYYTQTEDEKLLFWEYDFKFWFPVSCRPTILIHLPDNYFNYLNEILKSFFWDSIVIQIPHPVLPKNTIPVKLSIRNFTSDTIKNNSGYFSIELDSIIIPWFIYDISSEITHETEITNIKIQEYLLKQVSALFSIYENCKKQFLNNAYQNTNGNNHLKERLMSIDSNRIRLLELLKVHKNYWTEERINKILYYIKEEKLDLNQAIKNINEETSKKSLRLGEFLGASENLTSDYNDDFDSPVYVINDDIPSSGQRSFIGEVAAIAMGTYVGSQLSDKKTEKRRKKQEKNQEKNQFTWRYTCGIGCPNNKYDKCLVGSSPDRCKNGIRY